MRRLSSEKTELHGCASSEVITGDRSEVKRLAKLVTTWILEDPCIMIVHSLLSGWKGGEIVYRCFLYTGCSQILASETDGVVTSLPIRSLALGYGYIVATNDTTQQLGQTPDKEVEIKNITVYVSGYIESDTTGMLSPPTVWRQWLTQEFFRGGRGFNKFS